jgi:hypothetical protein
MMAGMKRRTTVMTAALAAGIGLAGVTGLAAPATARASTPRSWNLIFQARDQGIFQSIAAVSSTNVWAVAELARGSGIVYRPFITHFDGKAWKAVTIRGARMTSDAVQATSPTDVWVFGLTLNPQNIAASGAYRWDGKHWRKIPVPRNTYLQGTVVLGPSNVWAFGSSGTLPGDVFHWNGRKWGHYNLNFFPQFISASSARNVWLTGMTRVGKKEKATAYRWDGSRWRAVPTPHPVIDFGPGVTALSPSNVWIGWETTTMTSGAHWNGRRWRVITAPGNVDANGYNIIPDGRGGYWFGPFADWTSHAWISASNVSPANSGGAFGHIVRIPGTTSFLMAAGVVNVGSSTERPTIYRLNLPAG